MIGLNMTRSKKCEDAITNNQGHNKGRIFSKAVFIITAVLLLLFGVFAVSTIQARKKLQADMDQQLSQMVSQAVAQTLTEAAKISVTTPTLSAAVLPTNTSTSEAPFTETPTPIIIGLCSPIEGVPIEELKSVISQPFSVPNQLSDLGHHGVDLGSYNFHGLYLFEIPVRAILPGQVAGITVDRPPIGNVVILETKYDEVPGFLRDFLEMEPDQSLYHFYGHLVNEPAYEIGTRFDCGEQIDLLGKSRTVEAHLHLETRVGKSGLVISQMAFYDAATTEEERSEYLWWRTSGELTAVDPMMIFQAYLDQE